METSLRLIVAILATYRLARMLATEEGLGFPIGDKEKRKAGVLCRIREKIDPQQETWLGRGVRCPLCIGFWIALVVSVIIVPHTWSEWIINWLAIAGGQTFLQTMEN